MSGWAEQSGDGKEGKSEGTWLTNNNEGTERQFGQSIEAEMKLSAAFSQ